MAGTTLTPPAAAALQMRALARLTVLAKKHESERVFRGVQELRAVRAFSRFAEQQLFVKDKATGDIVPFRLNWIQRQILLTEIRLRRQSKKPNIIILKYRQGGVSTLQQALAFWEIWRRPNAFCRTFAHRDRDTRTIFAMVTMMYRYQPERHRHRKTEANTMWLQYPDWGSEYWAETAVASAGRGSRAQRTHLSEAAFYIDLLGLVGSLEDAQFPDAAFVWETTANGKAGRGQAFYETWEAARKGLNDFTPLFFAWHDNPDHVLPLLDQAYPLVAPARWWTHAVPDELAPLDPEEVERCEKYDLTPQQVLWWRTKRRRLQVTGGSANLILQEHPDDSETAFLEGGTPYYESRWLVEADKRCIPPLEVSVVKDWIDTLAHLTDEQRMELRGDVEHGRLRVWELPQPETRYAIGCDVSGGVSNDAHAAFCANAETGRQAFTWTWNRLLPERFGMKAAVLGWAWRSPGQELPAYIGIEQQNHGHAALAGLMAMAHYPVECIYHHQVQTQANAPESKRAGWSNNSQGHHELTAAVGRLLQDNRPQVLDSETVRSIRKVTSSDKGGADFQGRDLAVAAGITTIIMPKARPTSPWIRAGAIMIHSRTGESRPAAAFSPAELEEHADD